MSKKVKTREVPTKNSNNKKQNAKTQKKQAAKGYLMNKVPVKACYEEFGVIESVPGEFSVAYKVCINDRNEEKSIEEMKQGLKKILTEISKDFSFQIFIQNSTIQIDSFLNSIHLNEDKEPAVNKCIRAYNTMLDNNSEIGHNNFERSIYIILNIHKDIVDDAIAAFDFTHGRLVKLFETIYGYKIEKQTIDERLEKIFTLYHPEENTTFHEKSKQSSSVKAALSPSTYDFKHTNYLKVGNMYARTLFVNTIPSIVSHTLLNDLMATASNSVLSISCVPIETELAAKVAKKKVEDNTETKKVLIRNTVEDRKNKRTETRVERKRENEMEYFYEQANGVLSEAINEEDVVMMTTFLITLFAETKEDLDRNTKLLSLSASKFAVQIRSCEDFQDEAFQSIIPVCNTKVNTARFVPATSIAAMQPLRAKSVFSNTFSFSGLNSISDNFVLINRDLCKTGVISGIAHSGKSFSLKREALNKLMNSDEEVLVITNNMKPYDFLAKELNASVYGADFVNPYALFADEKLKKLFLSAYMITEAGLHTKRMSSAKKKANSDIMKREADKLSKFQDWNSAIKEINANKAAYSAYMTVLKHNASKLKKDVAYMNEQNRFKVVNAANDGELVLAIASALKYVKKKEELGIAVNVYIDFIDCLFFSDAGSDFIISVLKEFKKTKSSLTVVIQEAVRIFANMDASIEYNYFLENVDYYKLLAQGPIERRTYAEKLNIPNSLVYYLTDREPGEGVIITPAENVAFNDRFEKKDDPFYGLFYK